GVDLVAQAVAQSQIAANFPVVLRKSAVVISERLAIRSILRERGLHGITEQKVGKIIAANAAVEAVVSVFVADQKGDLIFITVSPQFKSKLHRVRSLEPRYVVAELEYVVEDIARMAGRACAAQKTGDLEFGHTPKTVYRRPRQPGDSQVLYDLIAL